MTTEEPRERANHLEERELSLISQGEQVLAELAGRIGVSFRRAEVRKRVEHSLQGLLASVERKNSWQMAEELGEANAHGVQRLLEEADYGHDELRLFLDEEQKSYVLWHLLCLFRSLLVACLSSPMLIGSSCARCCRRRNLRLVAPPAIIA